MPKNEYIRRPSGMLKHVVTPRSQVPADKVNSVRSAFMAGETRFKIARRLGIPYDAVCNLIMAQLGTWREEQRLARLVEDERRIIVTRTIVHGADIRHIRHSLPRISMHVAVLEGRL